MLVVVSAVARAQVVEVEADGLGLGGQALVLDDGVVPGQGGVLQLDVVGGQPAHHEKRFGDQPVGLDDGPVLDLFDVVVVGRWGQGVPPTLTVPPPLGGLSVVQGGGRPRFQDFGWRLL